MGCCWWSHHSKSGVHPLLPSTQKPSAMLCTHWVNLAYTSTEAPFLFQKATINSNHPILERGNWGTSFPPTASSAEQPADLLPCTPASLPPKLRQLLAWRGTHSCSFCCLCPRMAESCPFPPVVLQQDLLPPQTPGQQQGCDGGRVTHQHTSIFRCCCVTVAEVFFLSQKPSALRTQHQEKVEETATSSEHSQVLSCIFNSYPRDHCLQPLLSWGDQPRGLDPALGMLQPQVYTQHGGCEQHREGAVILVDPFQLGVFHDCMNPNCRSSSQCPALRCPHPIPEPPVFFLPTSTHTLHRAELTAHQPCSEKVHCAELPPAQQLFVYRNSERLVKQKQK